MKKVIYSAGIFLFSLSGQIATAQTVSQNPIKSSNQNSSVQISNGQISNGQQSNDQNILTDQKFLPEAFLHLSNTYSHHVILVEKFSHQIHVYENKNSIPSRILTLPTATGKVPGDKMYSGDKKTPEGVYKLFKFHDAAKLKEMYGNYGETYGIGAFVMNYPNFIDRKRGKTGGGIWLHATNDNSRIAKGFDSRGCVVVTDGNLKKIANYIDLNIQTPIVVVEKINFLDRNTWLKARNQLTEFIRTWSESWKNKDLNAYINHYSKTDFQSSTGRRYESYKTYKRSVFSASQIDRLLITEPTVFVHNGYAHITIKQNYKSNLVDDIGTKNLVLKLNNEYQWKIVRESWKKLPSQDEIAFNPSNRFFTE